MTLLKFPKAKPTLAGALARIADGDGGKIVKPARATMSLATPIVSSQDGPRMAGIANFGGKKAAPFGKGGKRKIAKAILRKGAKSGKPSRGSLPSGKADFSNNWAKWDAEHALGPGHFHVKSDRNSSVDVTDLVHTAAGLHGKTTHIGSVQMSGRDNGTYLALHASGAKTTHPSKAMALTALRKGYADKINGVPTEQQLNADFSTLSTEERKALPASAFVFPGKRAYPIHDEAHARDALARSSGKPEEAVVRAAVKARYPNIGKK